MNSHYMYTKSCLCPTIIHLLPGDCVDVAGPVGKAGFVGRRPVVTAEAK